MRVLGGTATSLPRARLHRDGKQWPVFLQGTPWCRAPIDDLYVGDLLEFPGCQSDNLVVRVVLTHGVMFRDVHPQKFELPRSGRYWLGGRSSCPRCHAAGLHGVSVAADGDHCGPRRSFGRVCADCGHQWTQEGHFPEEVSLMQLEDVL